MHEYARVASPGGPIWLAKETLRSNGDQILVGDPEDLDNLLPEIPLARRPTGLKVDNESTASALDLRFRYENADGVPVDEDVGLFDLSVETSGLKKARASTVRYEVPIFHCSLAVGVQIAGRDRTIRHPYRET